MADEKLKAIITGEVKVPKIIAGFVPGKKFKTLQEVDATIEEELKRED